STRSFEDFYTFQYGSLALCSNQPAYFGKGTKLTVLEKDVTEPTLEILSPSQNELCKRNRVTLICLATDFYPDHISITWDLPELNEPTRIKTDTPVLNGHTKLYSISSRLRVPKSVWCNPDNKFTCIVTFGMENGTETYRRSIHGSQDCVKKTELVKKNNNTAKFVYLMFFGKSVLYGLLISVFMWKMKPHSKDSR
uniref:Ig-like domain-containing protein n=1 Tax=Erpetoichthys calabaricus TaxID=27687 RepID=A0A8C4RTG6_ERPCA